MKHLYNYTTKYYLFLLLLCSFGLQAQQNVSETYSDEFSEIFSGLDKNRIPHGLLLDFAMDFTNIEAYNGQLSDSTNLNRLSFTNIYHTMLLTRVRDVSQGFMPPQELANTWEEYRRDNNDFDFGQAQAIENAVPTIVLSGQYFEYSKIREDALNQGDIQVQNNEYQDVITNGQWQNPYEDGKVFAMAAPINKVKGSEVNFLLPRDLWLTNKPNDVAKIEINTDDGTGFRQLNFDQNISISYTSLKKGGIHNIVFKLTLGSGETLQSRLKMEFGDPQKQGLQNPPTGKQAEIINADSFHFIESSETFNGKKGAGILTINYAAGRSEIKKPLIVVEGYDPGIITQPENIFGEENINNFFERVIIDGSSLDDLLFYSSTQEYDIIYVDWLNGVDDMRRNAKLLKTVIEWVNDQKAANGSTEENVVLGQSMGGVIARYALREMEIENNDHETRLYVSHDAPHQGANVPYGLQYMARHARNEYIKAPVLLAGAEIVVPALINEVEWFTQQYLHAEILSWFDVEPIDINYPSPYALLTLADMPASRQLLQNFIKRDYTRDNSVHSNWQNELQGMGYPQDYGIRNVAISNGSECGTPQEFDPGDYLFRFFGESSPDFLNGLIRMITDPVAGAFINNYDLIFTGMLPGNSEYNYNIWAKTIPTSSNQQVYKGRIVYTKKLLFLFPIDVVILDKNLDAPTGSLPIDTYPGGYYNVKSQIDLEKLPGFLEERITHLENFNFIPVTSSLDIGEGNLNLDEQDYLRSYSGGTPPSSPNQTPFDNFITAFNSNLNINANQQHIAFEVRNANWFANELEEETNIFFDCSFICRPMEISGESSLCSSGEYSIDTGANVQWSASPSNLVTITNNGNSNVTISKNSSSSKGEVTLTAIISSPNCGTKTLTKEVYVGDPDIFTLNPDGTKNYMGRSFSYSFSHSTREIKVYSDGPSATYTWDMFPTNIQWQAVNNKATFYVNTPGNYVLTCKAENECGEELMFFTINIGSDYNYVYYPNPASSEITIENITYDKLGQSLNSLGNTNSKGNIVIYDFSGYVVQTDEYDLSRQSFNLDVSKLKPGKYFIKIGAVREEETYQIIIRR